MLFLKVIKGILIGIAISAPVGPIGLLCIQRTLAKGRINGWVSGLGAATADSLYGMVASLGLTFVASFIQNNQLWFRSIGGLFLCLMGIKTYLSKPKTARVSDSSAQDSLWRAYLSAFFLTLANPLTVVVFTAVFAGAGIHSSKGDYLSAVLLVSTVFMGSALWWLTISYVVSRAKAVINPNNTRLINKISGAVLLFLGLRSIDESNIR